MTIRNDLARIVGESALLDAPEELLAYDCDGYTLERSTPDLVVLPASTAEVSRVVAYLAERGIAFVPRGAGTGLSGGCLPVEARVMIGTSRMTRILEIDPEDRTARVEAGVRNAAVSDATKPWGLVYAPDPSSQSACTIGGNVAENSGGPHTLRYGVTTNHVLAVRLVLPDGEVVDLGGAHEDAPGYDLRSFVIGSEGTTGIVTEATLRLVPRPAAVRTLLAVFDRFDDASEAVSAIVASGIVPAALEMMDDVIVAALGGAGEASLPGDAEAILLIEVDGPKAGIDGTAEQVRRLCDEHGAREVRAAADEPERARLWRLRKRAFGAMGRLARSYCTQDGVVPRTRVPEILRVIRDVGAECGLRIGNVFHAGDGNIHPILLYDEEDPDQVRRVLEAGDRILRACVTMGGSLTGEHGIGVEKMHLLPLLFSDADRALMNRVRAAFDPQGLANPGKVLPDGEPAVRVRVPRRRAAT